MHRVIESRKISPQTATAIGISIHRTGLHIGVLYRVTKGDSVRILHLGHHHGLASDEPSTSYVCWVRPLIESDRAKAIAAYCRRIWKQNDRGKVPYGFSVPTEFFDASGKLLNGPAKVGLTCASFVLAVFDGARFPLVKTDTWPKQATTADIDRQNELLERQRALMEAAHARNVQAEIGSSRYHSLDVAGAGTAESFPTDYVFASKVGAEISKLLMKIGTNRANP